MNLKKSLIIVFILGIAIFVFFKLKNPNNSKVTYKTEKATKGTLIVSVSASGKIANSGLANITTSLSGVVKSIYVKDGETVSQGQKIAEVELDEAGKKVQQEAYSSFLSAKNSLNNAFNNQESARMQVDKDETSLINYKIELANGADSENEKLVEQKNYNTAEDALNLSVKKYNDSKLSVEMAQIQLSIASQEYQEASAIIYAPTNGAIQSLFVSSGSYLNLPETSTSNNGSTTTTLTKIGLIKISKTKLLANISLNETDVPKVKVGQNVNMTLDAFADKFFSGKVLSIDVIGATSSGVNSYPATIIFDDVFEGIYPNMGVTAEIITNVKDGVILVSSSAIKTNDTGYYIEILKDGQLGQVVVTVGESNGTQSEIVSGINEGDEVITGTVNSSKSSSSNSTTSIFGNTRGFGGMGAPR